MNAQLKLTGKKILKLLVPAVVVICMLVLPNLVFGQNPGDNPDARPPEVPLDPRMTVLLIAVGSFIAVKIIKKANSPIPAIS